MRFRSIGLALLITAGLGPMALAQQGYGTQQQGAGGQSPYGTGQQPYATRQPYQQTPYGAQPYQERPYEAPSNTNGAQAQPYPPTTDPMATIPPMNAPQQHAGIQTSRLDPPGYGWCRYGDDADKTAYYSAPFPGSPRHDITPRDKAFTDYIHRAFPGKPGLVTCAWKPFDSAYDSEGGEQESESNDQLKNYRMINTEWKPAAI
jgi:hypothetical protein